MEPLVSVIIPVFKAEAYLDICLTSVLAQIYQHLQIILVNDGSPDRCGEICDHYARQDSRIQVIHKQNGGSSDALNVGLSSATGDYVTFVDADDRVDSTYVSYLLGLLVSNEADISICNFYTVRGSQQILWTASTDAVQVLNSMDATENLLYAQFFDASAWGKLYKRSCFNDVCFPVGTLYNDVATCYRLLMNVKKVAVGARPQYYYYMHPKSITNREFDQRTMTMLEVCQEMRQYVCECAPSLYAAATRKVVYACFYILKTMGNEYPSYPEECKTLCAVVRENRFCVLRDSKASMRDKAAILLLTLGLKPFMLGWNTYCVLTGRNKQ